MSSTPNLHTLPTELLLQICKYLDPPTTACLTLITRGTYFSLPHNAFPKRSPYELNEYRALLHRVAASDPRWVACNFCVSLHERDVEVPGFESNKAVESGMGIEKSMKKKKEKEKEKKKQVSISRWNLVRSGANKPQDILLTIDIGNLNTVYGIVAQDLSPALLRGGRAAGSLLGKGICVHRFSRSGTETLKLCDYSNSSSSSIPTIFSAKVTWETKVRFRRVEAQLLHRSTYTIIPDFSLSQDPQSTKFKRVLAELGLSCCSHCPPGGVAREVICKIGQLTHPFRANNCVSAERQPDFRCGEHWHKCGCRADIKVVVRGGEDENGVGKEVVVMMWRVLGRRTVAGVKTVKKRYDEGVGGA